MFEKILQTTKEDADGMTLYTVNSRFRDFDKYASSY